MYLVLYGVGLLVIAAGFLTIGFGIPINAFSLGNTLIIAGTVAVVGGVVAIGLAACIRQLNKIGEALASRPVTRPAAAAAPAPAAKAEAPAESFAPPVARIPPAPAPAPVPPLVAPRAAAPKSPEPMAPRPPEPHFPAANETRGPLDWLRTKPKAGDAPPLAAEQPDVSDDLPEAPRAPQRQNVTPPRLATRQTSEAPTEPKAWTPSRSPEADSAPKFDVPLPRSDMAARSAPPREREEEADPARPAGKDAGLFDVVWPDARSKPIAPPVAPRREPEPKPEVQQPRDEARAEPRIAPAADRVAILKSGVIDGMAYTLYADGSIEAELPQGTVRFASVDALRAHLEKSA